MRKSGYEIMWGVGRHGPGSNVFSYFVEPNGFVTEYTTEVEQVDDTTSATTRNGGRLRHLFPCRWNMAGAPSEFARKAMSGELYEEENQRCEAGDGARRSAADVATEPSQSELPFVLLVCWPSLARSAARRSYPTRTVEIMVPFAVGGSNDIWRG